MNTRSIRFRLAADGTSHCDTVAFALLGALLYVTERDYLDDTILQTQARRARQIAETLVANVPATGEGYVVSEIKALYAPELGDRFIRVTRADGSLLYLSGPPNDQSFDPAKVRPAAPMSSAEFSRRERSDDGRSLTIAAFRAAATDGKRYLIRGRDLRGGSTDVFARHLLRPCCALGLTPGRGGYRCGRLSPGKARLGAVERLP